MERKTVISSLIYKFIESFLVRGISFLISIILARLLTPEVFGEIAILMVFINISQVIIESGLNSALVQSKEVSNEDYSTVTWISLAVAIILILVIYIIAPYLSRFYNGMDITAPLRVYSIVLIFAAINSVQFAKMQREMQFRQMMLCNLFSIVFAGTLGVGVALLNGGIWALIVFNFSKVMFSCLFMLYKQRWLPGLIFSVKRGKRLFRFGWKMLISTLLYSVYNDIRSLVIGKKFSSEMLGFYDRGQQLPRLVSNTLDTAVQSVMFPVLSVEQDRTERIKAILKRSMNISAMVVVPVMFGLAAVSDSVIRLLLTEKWLPSVVLMQIICIAETTYPLTSSNLVAIKAMGEMSVYMRLEVVRRVVMLAILLISLYIGKSVVAIAVGYAVSAWLDVIIISVVMKRLLNYGFIKQIKDIWKIFLCAIIMALTIVLVSKIDVNIILELIIQISCGATVYIALAYIIKVDSLYYMIDIVKKLKKSPTLSSEEQ